MSRRTDLEARRQVLLLRCDQQRTELSRQFARLRTAGALGLPSLDGTVARAAGDLALQPLAWLIPLAGLLFFGRTREVLKMVVWARTALAVASRLAQVVRFVASVRAARPRRAAARPPTPRAREPEPPARSAS